MYIFVIDVYSYHKSSKALMNVLLFVTNVEVNVVPMQLHY